MDLQAIQQELQNANIDGWLFYDFHNRDAIGARILGMDTSRFMSLPIRGTHPLTKFRSFGTLSDRFFVNGFGRDLSSAFARRRYQKQKFIVCDGECRPEELFYLRWESSAVPTWKE